MNCEVPARGDKALNKQNSVLQRNSLISYHFKTCPSLPLATDIAIISTMRRFLFITLLLLLLRTPQASKASAFGQNTEQRNLPETAVPDKTDRFPESEDDIFPVTYERELLSRKIFKKSLPPLSRKDKIIWSFKTARANTFL